MRSDRSERNSQRFSAAPKAGFGMRNYLDLIPVSGRVHRRQSRMTRICIVLAVALVAVIFGMADMAVRCQKMQAVKTDGGWHAAFKMLTQEQEAMLKARPEAETASWYNAANYRLDEGYELEGRPAAICGVEESFLDMFEAIVIEEGAFPEDENSALFTKSVKEQLGAKVGDELTFTLPDGSSTALKVSGFTGDHSTLTVRDAFGIFVTKEAFGRFAPDAMAHNQDGVIYVKFIPRCNIQKTIQDIKTQLGLSDDQVGENVRLLGLMGQSSDSYIRNLYLVAAVLAVLVMVAGILMIAGSLNSNIAQRTDFFGMLRCLGATPRQVMRFVRLEALNWCKTAIPAGLAVSLGVIWLLCAMLRHLSPTYFGEMPVWGVSAAGIGTGVVMGIVTVLLAAQAPAKKAAGVSPLAAVSGNAGTVHEAKKAAETGIFSVDTALGIHHAAGSKKNFVLMAGSFAFTIILFLTFSASIDFMNHAVTPLQPYTPDLSVVSTDNTCTVPKKLAEKLSQMPSVKRAYGRRFAYDVPVLLDGKEGRINLISYEEYQFDWAQDMLVDGSIDAVKAGEGVMISYAYAGENLVQTGSTVTVNTAAFPGQGGRSQEYQLKVSAVLSNCPFDREEGTETVICSEALFEKLTGEKGYTIIDLQLEKSATDEDVAEIRSLAGESVSFSDRRLSNQEVKGAFLSYAIFLYGFLAIIALISSFNIVNSIAMSVSARIRQYGAMRAVGMSDGQVAKMVAAESLTYVLTGIVTGLAAGLPLHRFVFLNMVTSRWGDPWYVPVRYLGIILFVVAVSSVAAVWEPVKRIRGMSIVDTIGDC